MIGCVVQLEPVAAQLVVVRQGFTDHDVVWIMPIVFEAGVPMPKEAGPPVVRRRWQHLAAWRLARDEGITIAVSNRIPIFAVGEVNDGLTKSARNCEPLVALL